MDDFPGFNALLATSWFRTALTATGDPALEHFYYDCLMRVGDAALAAAVEDAVCTLRRMPADRTDVDVPAADYETACTNRLGDPNAAEIVPVEERCYDNYLWRLDPYEIPQGHVGTPGKVHSPEDWLLAYWLGRYHGFIPADL